MTSSPPSFLSHLVAVLSIYELATPPSSSTPQLVAEAPQIPRWDGGRTWETDAILQSLGIIGNRLGFSQPQLSKEEILAEHPADLQNLAELPLPPQHRDMPSLSPPLCSHPGSPLGPEDDPVSLPPGVVPPGGLLSIAAQNDISALEELRLLKTSLSDVSRVCNAVARGDLTQTITLNVHGIVANQLKDVVNTMVDKLSQFSKIVRASLEVNMQGYVGVLRDAEPGGTWSELTSDINKLLATQINLIRAVAEVVKAVAQGDLSRLIDLDVNGEMLDVKITVNYMVFRLRDLVTELTSMTLEAGSGRGSSNSKVHNVPGVDSGVWFDLLKNVNRVCSNLNDQVEYISRLDVQWFTHL